MSQWKVMGVQWEVMRGQWEVMRGHGRLWDIGGRSWEVIGRSGETSGGSWEVSGRSWEVSGVSWEVSGRLWEVSGKSREVSGCFFPQEKLPKVFATPTVGNKGLEDLSCGGSVLYFRSLKCSQNWVLGRETCGLFHKPDCSVYGQGYSRK